MPLAAGELHHRHVVLLRDLADLDEVVGRGDAAVDPRDDRERAILLDVGVNAVVDEAGVALVDVLACPRCP